MKKINDYSLSELKKELHKTNANCKIFPKGGHNYDWEIRKRNGLRIELAKRKKCLIN